MSLEEKMKQFIEAGASLEHDRWARWQKYMMSKMATLENGNMILSKQFVERWFRQIKMLYSELSESEKESDRKETRNYLPLVESYGQQCREEERKRKAKKIEWPKKATSADGWEMLSKIKSCCPGDDSALGFNFALKQCQEAVNKALKI